VASLLWRRLPTSLGAGQLNLLKNLLAVGLQLPLVLAGPWQASPRSLALLALSGIVGIALGDGLFFAALRRLGTRRTLTLDAGGPAVTALAGMALLGEVPGPAQWLGLALISLAVLLVVSRGSEGPPPLPGERPGVGVLLALGALVCGSAGALLSRAALTAGGPTPLQAATVRLAAASLVLLPLLPGLIAPSRSPRPARARWPVLLTATLLGTSAGIVLQQTALAGLPGGLAVGLLATAPVMALPLARLDGDRPGILGVIAALVALAGVSLVVGLLPWRS
jgi:drug/metabolite transporter (DMT)-like permease